MYDVILNPLKGIHIVGKGEILFGDDIKKICQLLGNPSLVCDNEYFFDKFEIKFMIDDHNLLEFAECIYGQDSINTKPIIYGKEVFCLEADTLVTILSEKSNYYMVPPDRERYIFDEIEVGLFREFSPERVNELIEELIQDNIYNEEDEGLKQTIFKSNYFQTISLGIKGYWAGIRSSLNKFN